MGQQQLLLIVLAVVIVLLAIIGGIKLFGENAVSENRDAVITDLLDLSGRAQQYYRRPQVLGGGQNSFVGLTADALGLGRLVNTSVSPWVNENGSYSITTAGTDSMVILHGTGNEMGNSETGKVEVAVEVRPGRSVTTIIN